MADIGNIPNSTGALTVKEADGSPNVSNVTTVVVSNGTLTDDGNGQVTLSTTSGTLTVQEADGSPSVASVTTLQFDQADGFVVSTPGAGTAKVDLAAVPLTVLAAAAANTTVANATSGSAVPTAVAVAASRLWGRDASGNLTGQTVGGGVEFTSGGIQRSALTGDVTAPAGSNATTVANCELSSLDIVGGTALTAPNPFDDSFATYDSSAGANRRVLVGDMLANSANWWMIRNDFLTAAATGLTLTSSGTGAANTAGTGDVNHPGVVTFDIGTATNGLGNIISGTSAILLGGGRILAECIFMIDTLSDATDTYTLRAGGFADVSNGDSVDGIYIRYTHGTNSGKFEAITRANSVESAADTGVTAAIATWYHVIIAVNADATSVTFTINGSLTNTATTNIPSGAGRNTGWGPFVTRKSAGTTSRTFQIDYCGLYGEFTTAR